MKKDKFGLTPKQRQFCDTLLADPGYNQAQAYAATYKKCSDNTARINSSRLLTNANVRRYLDTRKKEREERLAPVLNYNLDKALIDLYRIRTNAMQEIPLTKRVKVESGDGIEYVDTPVLDKDGNRVMDMLDRKEATKAVELLGKHFGGWPNKLTVDLTTIKLEDMVLAEQYNLPVEEYMRRRHEGTLPSASRPAIEGAASRTE